MTTYGTIYLFLSYFAPLFVLGDDNVPISNEAPVLRCDGGICTLNTTGTNFELSAELLEKQIGPDVVIINQEEHFGKDSFKEGVIIVAYTHDVTRVSSALLSKTAVVDFGVYHQQTGFTQNLLDSPDGTVIGVVKVARPIHDPDTRFASLAQDPLLAGIPIGLRSEVDPAALIPSPTKGCDTNRCVAIIPSADVFYFGPDPTNTACLSAITNPPPLPTLPQVNMEPSYVYVVYPGEQIFDGCRNWIWGNEVTVTASFLPWQLSTLEYRPGAPPATKILDLADLPCPPSDVAEIFDSGAPYFPVLSPPYAISWASSAGDQSLGGSSCEVAAIRDPPVRARRVGHISGPNDGGDTIA